MSENLDTIDSLPDISFIDNLSLEDLQGSLLGDFVEKYQELTGKKIQLSKSDPYRIMLLSCAQLIYQGLQNVDKAGKMNFLKYAYDGYLDNMAALKRITRNQPKHAQVPVKFTLSGKRESATGIPAGTKVTAADGIYFATTGYAEIPAGETEVTVMAGCTEAGVIGNGYAIGEINTLADPVGFVASVSNTGQSSGGAGTEDDQNLAERVYLAPSSFSTAGPDDAYTYWVKDYSPDIGDVKVSSPSPGIVDIRFIMADGTVPGDTTVQAVKEHVSQRGRRPLTDCVQVNKPDIKEYTIDFTYYISLNDSNIMAAIQEQVAIAVEEYKNWQASKIGRDINPDELVCRIKNAGAKRAVVRTPVFLATDGMSKAECTEVNIIYGGLEDG